MDHNFVHQIGFQSLLRDTCAAANHDSPVARRSFGLSDCAFDAVCDEDKGGVAFSEPFWNGMRNNKMGYGVGVVYKSIEPLTLVIGAPTHHHRARLSNRIADDLNVDLVTFREIPVVKREIIWRGDKPIEGERHIEKNCCHKTPFLSFGVVRDLRSVREELDQHGREGLRLHTVILPGQLAVCPVRQDGGEG